MMRQCLALFIVPLLAAAMPQQYLAFDAASATSTYSTGNLVGSPAFAAQQAMSGGSGYWCSSGSHAAGQSVTWTGVLNTRRVALGVKIDWAYAPAEIKVLTSSDGANFEEAQCWQASARKEVAFEQSLMFSAPRSVKAVAISMRGTQSWGYFGLNSVAVIAEPGPFMLVSGITSSIGEQCLVSVASFINVAPCAQAVAAGDGREVMEFDVDGQLVSKADGNCLTLADGDTAGGGVLRTLPCSTAVASSDGRGIFTATANGQLKMPRLGNYCVTMAGNVGSSTRAIVQDCAEAEDNADSRDKFFMVAVPELDLGTAAMAKQQATLLRAAEEHLGKLLAELHAATPSLAACGFKSSLSSLATSFSRQARSRSSGKALSQDASSDAVAAVAPALGIDMEALRALVTDVRSTLASISR